MDGLYGSKSSQYESLKRSVKVLVVGAGGLGCEILRSIAMLGIVNIDIIDMDTIELSNLNRQLLFSKEDIGKPKAIIAAAKILSRYPHYQINAYYNTIEEMPIDFYRKYNFILCGVDSLDARRYINNMVLSIAQCNHDSTLNQSSIIPVIDGGTEGLKGHVQIIIPYITSCIDCNLEWFTPQNNFAICSIANNPRQPYHCVEYAKNLLWKKNKPYGENVEFDSNNSDHIHWVYQEAKKIANKYHIEDFTEHFTEHVVKNIIPAVISMQTIVASKCVIELENLLKIENFHHISSTYTNYNLSNGFYTMSIKNKKNKNCYTCGQSTIQLTLNQNDTLQSLIDILTNDSKFQLDNIGNITCEKNGNFRALIMQNPKCLYETTKNNLKKCLKDLDVDNSYVIVTFGKSPFKKHIQFFITLKNNVLEMD